MGVIHQFGLNRFTVTAGFRALDDVLGAPVNIFNSSEIMRHMIQSREHIFFDLALEDITTAADLFRLISDRTKR